MKKIAITGNIGSGKSTVCRIFETLGMPVYKADEAGHKLLAKDTIIQQITDAFGENVLQGNQINRSKLAEIVFQEAAALKKLNEIIHTRVIDDFIAFSHTHKHFHYIVFESALIFEASLDEYFDKIVLVYAPDLLKIKRVIERDKCDTKSVKNRLKNQHNDKQKIVLSDYVIYNDETQLVIPQVLQLHKTFIKEP